MLKNYALWFGIVLLIIGVLGFIPPASPHAHLIGIFEVNTLHNIVHLVTGAIAVWVGFVSERASRLFFQIFGVVYALVALLGFLYGDAALLGVMAHNWADAWLHVVIAVLALYLGFAYHPQRRATVS